MCDKANHNMEVLKILAEKLLPDLEKMVEKAGMKSVRIKRTGTFLFFIVFYNLIMLFM